MIAPSNRSSGICNGRILLLLIFINIFLKSILWFNTDYALQPDSQSYIENAIHIQNLNFEGMNIRFPWLYSFFIALVKVFFNSSETSARIVSVFFSTTLIFPIFYLSLSLFNRTVSIISVLLIIFNPWINKYSISAMSEVTYMSVSMGGIFLGYHAWKSQKQIFYFFCGVVMGLAYLTRSEGIGFGITMLLWLAFSESRKPHKRWKNLLLYTTPFLMLISVFVFFLHWRTGVWTLTYNIGNIAGGVVSGKDFEIIRYDLNNIYAYILMNIKPLVLKFIYNIRSAVCIKLPEIFSPILMLIAGLGVWNRELWMEHKKRDLYFILIFLIPQILLISVSHVLTRYLLVLIPILLILTAKGIEELHVRSQEVTSLLLKRSVVLGIILFFFSFITLSPIFRIYFNLIPIYEIEYKETGLWIRENTPQNSIIFSQTGVVDFYAQRQKVLIRQQGKSIYDTQDLESILSQAYRKNEPCYLIVQQRWASSTLGELLDEKIFRHHRLRPVYLNNRYPRAKVIVYKILKF